MTNTRLSRQNTFFFVATKVCLSRQNIILSRQAYFCRNKHVFDEKYVCCDKTFCRDKQFSRKKSFVAASILLSRHKTCFVATNACLSRQKSFLRQLPPMIINTIPLHCILCDIASGKVLINTIPFHCILYDNDCIVYVVCLVVLD